MSDALTTAARAAALFYGKILPLATNVQHWSEGTQATLHCGNLYIRQYLDVGLNPVATGPTFLGTDSNVFGYWSFGLTVTCSTFSQYGSCVQQGSSGPPLCTPTWVQGAD